MDKAELLSEFESRVDKFEKFQSFIEKAKSQAGKFAAAVVDKVIADNREKSMEVVGEIIPFMADMEAVMEQLEVERVTAQESAKDSTFKLEELEFPFSVSNFSWFLRVNEEPMGRRDVDVYETKAVPGDCDAFTTPVPLRVSRERFDETGELLEPVRLLLLKGHYVGIRPDTWKCQGGGTCFQRIFSTRGDECKVCPRCITCSQNHYDIKKHMEVCKGHDPQRVIMSMEDSYVSYRAPHPA